jgi:hypothetical protein
MVRDIQALSSAITEYTQGKEQSREKATKGWPGKLDAVMYTGPEKDNC